MVTLSRESSPTPTVAGVAFVVTSTGTSATGALTVSEYVSPAGATSRWPLRADWPFVGA